MKYGILLFFVFSTSLFGQDLDSKKQQLDELRQQLKAQEEMIKQAEAGKVKSTADLNAFKKKKRETEKKQKKLKKSEKNAKETLLKTESEINKTASHLDNLEALCQREYLKLFQAHYQGKIYAEEKYDGRLLAALLLRTAEEINIFENTKSGLETTKKKHNKKYEDLIWSRIVEKKRGTKYSKKMKTLQTDITRLTEKEKKAKRKRKELEKSVKALNNLISKLQSELTAEDYSYKFSSERLGWPAKGEILRKFGEQPTDKYKVSILNNGIDIAVPEGTEVIAVDDGVIAFAQWYSGAGKLIIIDHKNGFFSLYSHNSRLLVTKGDTVSKNQKIALSGSSGSAEEPFLHFELRKRGKPVDPLNYLE